MALVPASKWTAGASGGLNPGSSTGGAGSSPWYQAAATISTLDVQALGGYATLQGLAPASAAWPVANTAIFVPFSTQVAITVQRIGWINGAAVSGNVDAGIYNEDGTRIASIGSTAQAGTSVVQSVAIGPSALAVGSYYIGLAVDNVTATIMQSNPSIAGILRAIGVQAAVTSFPLPATATFANPAATALPMVAVSMQTFL